MMKIVCEISLLVALGKNLKRFINQGGIKGSGG